MGGVDLKFIHELEDAKGEGLVGKVPLPNSSKSGTTIASGVDLGQMNSSDLRRLKLDRLLNNKLAPSLGLRGADAVKHLAANPLTITQDESDRLDAAMGNKVITDVVSRFDAKSKVKFASLKSQQQTVVTSVAFQYGANLDLRTPNFWKQVVTGDWQAAVKNLNNFGDNFPTRRKKEAALLSEVVDMSTGSKP